MTPGAVGDGEVLVFPSLVVLPGNGRLFLPSLSLVPKVLDPVRSGLFLICGSSIFVLVLALRP
jgi:hypothetical protein